MATLARRPLPSLLAMHLLALFAAAGLAACTPDPADAPPIGEAAVTGSGGTGGAAASPGVMRVGMGADTFAGSVDRHARAQVEFRLAHHDARERLLAALDDCARINDPDGCSERALRAYDAEIAEVGRRTGLRADQIVPLDQSGVLAEGMPVVQVAGNRG